MKVREITWEIACDRPNEIIIKGTGQGIPGSGNASVSVIVTTITLHEKLARNGEKEYSGIFEVEPIMVSHLNRVGQNFKITLNQQEGDVPPFREIIGCSMIGEPNTIMHFMASNVIPLDRQR